MEANEKGGGPKFIDRWKKQARELRLQTYALYLAYRDPRTPWYAKAWAGLVLAYAFSPIDLIPDFIPVLGYLDDLVLVPLGIALALRMIPAEVLVAARKRAEQELDARRPVNQWIVVLIVLVWVGILALVVFLVYSWLRRAHIGARP